MRRRDLLLGIGLAGPAFATGRSVRAEGARAPITTPRVGVAIVGVGSYARIVLERTRGLPAIAINGLVSGAPDRARGLAADLGITIDAAYGYGDFDRLAGDERIHAVHICLPVGLHAEFAERALKAGKHVLCEKPLAATSGSARHLQALAAKSRLVLMPAYRAWFSRHVQEIRRRVAERTHGNLVAIDAHKGFRMRLPEGNWRFDPALAGGGCLPDIGIYSLQLCRWIGGGLPQRVSATTLHDSARPGPDPIEDHVAFTLEFADGVLATGSASWRYRLQNRLRVATNESWMNLDPATPVTGERLTIALEQPTRIEEHLLPVADQLVLMYQHFADCVTGRAMPQLTAQDAIDDLRLMEAVYASARSGRRVSLG